MRSIDGLLKLWFFVFATWTLLLIRHVYGAAYVLEVTQNADKCYGGEVCGVQPIISITDHVTGQVAFTFSGSAYVQLGSAPTPNEKLYYGAGCGEYDCQDAVVGSSASVTFVSGFATFSDIYFTTAGIYTLKFIARTSSDQLLAMTFSANITVQLNDPFKLIFTQTIGIAYGGETFGTYPTVGVADRGGNLITTQNYGNITATLTTSPTGCELLRPVNMTTVSIADGEAMFDQLYIMEAGSGYEITFTTSLKNISAVTTLPFTVAVGSTVRIESVLGYFPTEHPIYSGEMFSVTPKVRLLDSGNNLVYTDSSSAIQISLFQNPTGAKFGLEAYTFVQAQYGIVQFRNLVVDLVGTNYTFLYELYSYSALAGNYTYTGVSSISERFNVLPGPARKLILGAAAETAWAGQQGFLFQPIVALTDYGNNVIANNVTNTVTISIIPSLAVNKQIIIDTSNAPAISFDHMLINASSGTYGVGYLLQIALVSKYYIYTTYDDVLPSLRLNIAQADGNYARAVLVGDYYKTKRLIFEYMIQTGDYLNTTEIISFDVLALVNGSTIIDGNGHSVNTSLPIQTLNATIVIDTSIPQVIGMNVNTTDGEYGAGQVIQFSVTFNQQVEVSGFPYLVLNVGNETRGHDAGVAVYSSLSSDRLTVYFDYHILPGQFTVVNNELQIAVDYIHMVNTTVNATLIDTVKNVTHLFNITTANITSYSYDYRYRDRFVSLSYIRRYATFAIQDVNATLPLTVLTAFNTSHHIHIDTTPPSLDVSFGLQSSSPSGKYYTGDVLTLNIKFNKDIVVYGTGLALYLDVAPTSAAQRPSGAAYYISTDIDNRTVYFEYIIQENTNTTLLDIKPGGLSLLNTSIVSSIRRLSTYPTTIANYSTTLLAESNNTLKHSKTIELDGFPATVQSVTLNVTDPAVGYARTLYPDDIVTIKVQFSSAVFATCPPVFILQMNTAREAYYTAGNGTDEFLFTYKIQVGDYSPHNISYRNRPNGLCARTGCLVRTTCQILMNTTYPSLAANLKLSYSAAHSVAIAPQAVNPYPKRNTSITTIYAVDGPREYGVGSVLDFRVVFNDAVIIQTPSRYEVYPTLRLSIGKEALYLKGNYGKVLTFRYIATANDTILSTDLSVEISNMTDSAVICNRTAGCLLTNVLNQAVDLNMTHTNISSTGITLNPSQPNITKVYLDYSQYENYTAGQVIRIVVIPSKPVIVVGLNPRILLAVGEAEQYAVYNRDASSDTVLNFDYKLLAGETATNITMLGTAIDIISGYAQIYRESTIPTTIMDVTLPRVGPFVLAESKLRLNPYTVPTVVGITALSASNVKYQAGDKIYLQIEFSLPIYAYGTIALQLNLGEQVSQAYFIGYKDTINESLNFTRVDANTVTNATNCLVMEYIVQANDTTPKLDYVDISSLTLNQSGVDTTSYIRRYPDEAAVTANFTLPVPGESGSLSASSNIIVDGRAPRIIAIYFINEAGMYTVNDTITIAVEFNLNVVVLTTNMTTSPPSILLETGAVKNEAVYVNGSGSNVLYFQYHPAPGDVNYFLDYYADRNNFNDASQSFLLNGARIVAKGDEPFLDAYIYLNPPGGYIGGKENDIEANDGIFQFVDSYITKYGSNYDVFYSCATEEEGSVLTYETKQTIFNSFSAEYQLLPEEAITAEQVGYSVDIHNNIAVVGAPNFNVSVTTIQVVSISLAPFPPTKEVQVISTSITPQPAIQTFYTTTDIDETIGGYFNLYYGSVGPTQNIPASANSYTLQSIIENDLASLGRVTVTTSSYLFCACYNAYVWTVTFLDQTEGDFIGLATDGTLLTSTGVIISSPVFVQKPSKIAGTFTLNFDGLVSPAIPYNANASYMSYAIETLGLTVDSISTTSPSIALEQSWSVTFDAYHNFYGIPALGTDSSGLTGGPSPSVFALITQQGYQGPDGIQGYFQLQFRNEVTTALTPNATAAQVKTALEALPVINEVNVNRTLLIDFLGAYSWTIEFVSVNVLTTRGYFVQPTSNIEPLVAINNLIASEVEVVIDAKYDFGGANKAYSKARQGSFGSGAGAAFVYQRVNTSWVEIAYLLGNDTIAGNNFGSQVAVHDNVIAITARGANMNGKPEIQAIHCHADSGYFTISFRGWQTMPIPFNVTETAFNGFIQAEDYTFAKLYTVNNIEISSWEGGLCQNNTAYITFLSPVNGAPNIFNGVGTGADLELLTLTSLNLTLSTATATHNSTNSTGQLEVYQVQRGTWRVNDLNSDPQQIGAVYIYRQATSCSDNNNNKTLCLLTDWQQEAQLFPPASMPETRFGERIQLTDSYLVISAPGIYNESGAVFLYSYDTSTATWSVFQSIYPTYPETGLSFGYAFAMYGKTLAIAGPGYGSGGGAVYVYYQSTVGAGLIVAQTIYPPSTVNSLQFGYSIAVDQNTLVIGTPFICSNATYLGLSTDDMSTTCTRSAGAVFVYTRVTDGTSYFYREILTPSDVQAYDGFGYQLKIQDDLLLAVATETLDSTANNRSSKPIVQIEVNADYGTNSSKIGGSFRLQWKAQNSTLNNGNTTVAFALRTREIPYNTTALQMRLILETDLQTGQLSVSRSRPDLYTGGYAWTVTFLKYIGQNRPLDILNNFELFNPDTRQLTGTNATVVVSYINAPVVAQKNKVHVFRRPNGVITGGFIEQVYLTPFVPQAVDLCGYDLAISYPYALVGCPNRDRESGTGNSGAAFVYDLRMLTVRFNSSRSSVTEGNTAPIIIERFANGLPVSENIDVMFTVQTLDRNANFTLQQRIGALYGVMNGSANFYGATLLDTIAIVGTAVGRAQYYGNHTVQTSRWVDGRYDYRALADYVPLFRPQTLLAEDNQAIIGVITNDDQIVETPAENVTIIMQSPGIWPSPSGDYQHILTLDESIIQTGEVNATLQYTKVAGSEAHAMLGSVIAFNAQYGVLFASALQETSGKVLQYSLHNDSVAYMTEFTSPELSLYESHSGAGRYSNASGYGNALAVVNYAKESIAKVAIAQRMLNRVFIYATSTTSDYASKQFSYIQAVQTSLASGETDLFGEAIAFLQDLLIVSAPGIETVFIFERVNSKYFTTMPSKVLRSSDYKVDLLRGGQEIFYHRQGFGMSLAASDRSILIGSPYARYDMTVGYPGLTQNFNTEGATIKAVSKGKAYIFYADTAVVKVCLTSATYLSRGMFQLRYSHRNISDVTDMISYNASAKTVQQQLESLMNINKVAVKAYSSYVFTANNTEIEYTDYSTTQTSYSLENHGVKLTASVQTSQRRCWEVAFVNEFISVGSLSVVYNESAFSPAANTTSTNASIAAVYFEVTQLTSIGDWLQIQDFAPNDSQPGDTFGLSVAIDENYLVIGAPNSNAQTVNNWDFEDGNLLGWKIISGDAFTYQPTFGDNAKYHDRGRSSALQGRYYISTLEKRPGFVNDYTQPDPSYPAGQTQGVQPTGILLSDIFIIQGEKVSFRIGGGCDVYGVYIELLVDNVAVDRVTGYCDIMMKTQSISTKKYLNRAGQIRIVDNSTTSPWGFISVDDFQFSWLSTSNLPLAKHGALLAKSIRGKVDSVSEIIHQQIGVAYLFRRVYHNDLSLTCNDSSLFIPRLIANITDLCNWRAVSKLQAADQRSSMKFGSKLVVDAKEGIVGVSSPYSTRFGPNKDTLTSYPYKLNTLQSDAVGLNYPLSLRQRGFLSYYSTNSPLFLVTSGAADKATWSLMNKAGILPTGVDSVKAGAVYWFRKEEAVLAYNGQAAVIERWPSTETAKIQAPETFVRDQLGQALAISWPLIAVGAPGQDNNAVGPAMDSGAVYLMRAHFLGLKFSTSVYQVLEGSKQLQAIITVERDLQFYSGQMVIAYATNDLTAKGVDSSYYHYCRSIPAAQRHLEHCGHYEQTTGIITFEAGVNTGGFFVNLLDDDCYEKNPKLIQLTLSIPGADAIQGERYQALLRIDDDDREKGVEFCSTDSYAVDIQS